MAAQLKCSLKYITSAAMLYIYIVRSDQVWSIAGTVQSLMSNEFKSNYAALFDLLFFNLITQTKCRQPLTNISLLLWASCTSFSFNAAQTRSRWQIINIPLRVLLINNKFHLDTFFLKTVALWSKLSRGCFPEIYKLDLFKSMVNLYLAYTFS